ncbi:MAG: GNAT family N-acetyltransferase [Phycisphaerae bacterium]
MTSSPSINGALDPARAIWRRQRHALDAFFTPKNVAVIGATEKPGSVGQAVVRNLIASPFGGAVLPVNPKRPSVLGIRAYPNVAELPIQADLAVITTPAATVPKLIAECGAAGIGCVIVISAGFKEAGPDGVALAEKALAAAREHSIRLIGPNCLGLMCPPSGINASFAHAMARPGSVAFISQSGALCTAVLDWSLRESVGFSAFISIGSMLDVGFGDLLDYFGDDPHTRSIVMYIESIGDARAFLSAAREVALSKPIIVIKAGRTDAAAKAAVSHTGSLAGSDDAIEAAFRRVGVLRVDSIEDLFSMAEVLGKQPRPSGRKLTIVTNAGGPGVLATDALITGGGELTALSPDAIAKLNETLPPQWSHANPIDVLGDADAQRYAAATQLAIEDNESNGVLVVLTPQAMTDATATADLICKLATGAQKPVLASWMGGDQVAAGAARLNAAGIPVFEYPDLAARTFNFMWRWSYALRGIYETPTTVSEQLPQCSATAAEIIAAVRRDGRTILTEPEAKQLLAAYGIPIAQTRTAKTPAEAIQAAKTIGFPVVLKLLSHKITHKSDVGGVRLNLQSEAHVAEAFDAIKQAAHKHGGAEAFEGVTVQPMIRTDGYELLLGSTVDSQLGPVIVFGAGGQLVEIIRDRSLALPPLNSTLARRMMEQTRIFKALHGVRGRPPANMALLEDAIVQFSRLVIEQPEIREVDINPLLASDRGAIALDARVVLHDAAAVAAGLPRPAIRPYPSQYVSSISNRHGLKMTVRPIRPEDEPLLVKFHRHLSDQTVHQRYLGMLNYDARVVHERLLRQCFNDYDREIALVVELIQPTTNRPAIIGVGRLTRLPGTPQARFSMVVADEYQFQGIGSQLLEKLIAVARGEKISVLTAEMLASNFDMQDLCRRGGFTINSKPGDELAYAELRL